jgi:hypothetical protein
VRVRLVLKAQKYERLFDICCDSFERYKGISARKHQK